MNRLMVHFSIVTLFATVTFSSGCQRRRLESPKLAVVVVVDQMRADHLSRFAGLYKDGFKRLLDKGAVFTNAHHDHAYTLTGPGHATIATGSNPSRHGIVTNSWFDRIEKRLVYCAEDSAFRPLGYPDEAPVEGRAPNRMLVPALGDWLKAQSPKSKVFSVSRKSGAAVLMAGMKADAAYWYHSNDGNVITSEYYMKSYPPWVETFNQSRSVDHYFQDGWPKLMPEEIYFLAREDAFPTENGGKNTIFPHVFKTEGGKPDEDYYRALVSTPFADDLILDFAKTLITNEALGTDESPDLLFVGCSSADAIGHAYGPLSQESLDHFLRLDVYLGDFFRFLDQHIGTENYVVTLSSDHGVLPLPEELARRGFDAKRVSVQDLIGNIQKIFVEVAKELEIPERLITGFNPGLFLNYPAAESKGVSATELDEILIRRLKELELIADIFTKDDLKGKTDDGRSYQELYTNNFHPDRCGDLTPRFKKFYLLRGTPHGTTHGSPYSYDTHVPIVFMGAGIEKSFHSQKVRTVDIAPTLAECFGIKTTAEIDGRSLFGAITAE